MARRARNPVVLAVSLRTGVRDMAGIVDFVRTRDRDEIFGTAGSESQIHLASAGLGVALVGDVILRGPVGRTDLPCGGHAALIAAIEDKLLPLGDDIGSLCSHGPGFTFGEECRFSPFLNGQG